MNDGWVFPPPHRMHDKYRAVVLPKPEGEAGNGWPRSRIRIERAADPMSLETTLWDEVTTYDRNYSFLNTFEPFRQLRDGAWHEYALVSKRYVELEVISLETGETVASERPNAEKVQHAAELKEEYTTGKYKDRTGDYAEWWRTHEPEELAKTWGFCPVEFYVPEFWDEWWVKREHRAGGKSLKEVRTDLVNEWESGDRSFRDEHMRHKGDFAIYCGCVWGDDSSWKIQYIDLTTAKDGYVIPDDRFGYVELPTGVKLHDAVRYSDELDRFEIATAIWFDRDGKASQYSKQGINWSEDDSS